MPKLTAGFTLLCWLMIPTMDLQSALRAADGVLPVHEVRIAAVQHEIQGNQTIEQLFAKLETAVAEGVAAKADCIVFPELVTFDTWRVHEIESHLVPSQQEIEETRRIATEITPVFLRGMAELAQKYQVDILAGTTPRIEGSSIFNSAHMFFRDGGSFRQDKLYPTHWELKAGISPGSELATCDTRWGKCAILTCYDVEFPNVSALLVSEPPEIIFVPSMTESQAGLERVRWCAQARAVELHAFVIVAGTVGSPSPSWKHFGQAAFVTPRDSRLVENSVTGQLGEAMVLSTQLDLRALRESRQSTDFNPSADITSRGESSPIRVR
ncbi:MAG: nitrilase-related carbon-nitrogen hydrolase [Aureliella sp.]